MITKKVYFEKVFFPHKMFMGAPRSGMTLAIINNGYEDKRTTKNEKIFIKYELRKEYKK